MTKPKHPSALKGKSSKLTREDVIQARQIYEAGTQNARELAEFFGVNAETMRRALRGETWRELRVAMPDEEQLAADAASSLQRMQAMITAAKERDALADTTVKEISEATPSNPYPWIKQS